MKTEFKEQSWTWMDKSAWGAGPWLTEPDKVQWVDEKSKLDCLIVRNHMGSLCGYVGVPEGHSLFEKNGESANLDVHGGITFGDFCVEDKKEHGICHVPYPGRPDKIWWHGFDCSHYNDLTPELHQRMSGIIEHSGEETYRDISFVKAEVTRLAEQLME